MKSVCLQKLVAALSVCALSLTISPTATGASSADEALSVIVAFPPGGPTDRLARIMAHGLEQETGQTVVVENKPGASGMIAAKYVAHNDKPDNVLFFSNSGALTINQWLHPNLPYDPARDFQPVTMVADTTVVAVTGTSTTAETAAELIKQARSGGRQLSVASSGVGATSHLSAELFMEGAGLQMLHIPYKGAAPALTDLAGGRVDLFFGDYPGLQGLLQGGKLKALGIVADRESPLLPGVPTMAEQGIPGMKPNGWYGVVMSSKASAKTAQRLSESIAKVLKTESVEKQFKAMGATPAAMTPEQFGQFLTDDAANWRDVIKRRNIKLD